MNDESENIVKFDKPKNPTDPVVVFDPEFDFSKIAIPINPNVDGTLDSSENNNVDILSISGVNVPLLKMNNKFILFDKIYSLEISVKEFLPKIEVTLNDEHKNIQATDIPGMNNVITVILTAGVDGANKKMSMDFYITDCKFNEDDTVTYKGEYKCNSLKQVKYSQIGDTALSTYEYLYKIAKELKLGFACTDKCKEINDKKYRQLYSQTYIDYITKEIKHAGLDSDSVFDVWVDNFGYIVLVNLSYIFSEEVKPKQLSIKSIIGKNITTNVASSGEGIKQQVIEVYRIISNSQENINIDNLYISEYHSRVNNNNILNKGTKNRYYYLSSPCDQNLLVQKNLQVIENSIDGILGMDEYVYENLEFIGTNQNEEDVCEIYQEQVVENFFNSIYSKELEVTLDTANYSLQRGMLVYIMINEYYVENREFILKNSQNALTNGNNVEKDSDDSYKDNEKMIDENNGIMNPGLSGLYYIKDMTFFFSGGINRISQRLTLVPKKMSNNLNNKYTSVNH